MPPVGAHKNVQVLGIGHLAAAVRVQLRAGGRGDIPEDSDFSETLWVACSDFESPASFRDANGRALTQRSRILFAALTPFALRLGPVVEPGRAGCFECVAARWHGFEPAARAVGPASGDAPEAAIFESGHVRGARMGAALVVREVLASAATPYRGVGERRCPARLASGCPACGVWCPVG